MLHEFLKKISQFKISKKLCRGLVVSSVYFNPGFHDYHTDNDMILSGGSDNEA